MIKLNSPIWQKQKPPCMAVLRGFPLSRIPVVADSDLNTTMVPAIISIGPIYFTSTSGFTSMPTDTKNTAPNRFLIGVMIR